MKLIAAFARNEPAVFNSLVVFLLAVAASLGFDLPSESVWAILASLGVTTVATRRKVTPFYN